MLGVPLRFEETLTQVDQVALGLLLAAATPIGVGDAHRRKRIVAGDDDVIGDEVPVLEREDVQRSLELVPGKQSGTASPRRCHSAASGTARARSSNVTRSTRPSVRM